MAVLAGMPAGMAHKLAAAASHLPTKRQASVAARIQLARRVRSSRGVLLNLTKRVAEAAPWDGERRLADLLLCRMKAVGPHHMLASSNSAFPAFRVVCNRGLGLCGQMLQIRRLHIRRLTCRRGRCMDGTFPDAPTLDYCIVDHDRGVHSHTYSRVLSHRFGPKVEMVKESDDSCVACEYRLVSCARCRVLFHRSVAGEARRIVDDTGGQLQA